MAANSLGEEKSPAQRPGGRPPPGSLRSPPWRSSSSPSAVLLFSGNGGHSYNLVFQNASQLVPDNQVLIGGQPVGSVDSIDLTDDNLAEVTSTSNSSCTRARRRRSAPPSLAGVANHYVSISPGPNSNPPLEDGATLGLGSTTTPVDLDQFLNTFPTPVRRGLGQFIRGNAATYSGRGEDANRTFKYFAPALNRTSAFVARTERRPAAARALRGQLQQAQHRGRRSAGSELSSAISNANTAFGAIASQNVAFDQTLRLLPPVFRQSQHHLRQPARRARRPRPAGRNGEAGDQEPGRRSSANCVRCSPSAVPVFKNLRLTVRRKGFANDTGELLGAPADRAAARREGLPRTPNRRSPPSSRTSTSPAPTRRTSSTASASSARSTAYYDGNGHYARAQLVLNLFKRDGESGELKPIPPSQQYEAFGESAGVRRPCPGGATQSAADGSNPFTEPPFAGSGVHPSSECDPADAPPGP